MTVNNLGNLSQMTGLSQAELAKRAEQLVDKKTGKIDALAALEKALAEAAVGGKVTMDAFTAAGAASVNPHTIDDPLQAFTHGAPFEGFAPEPPALPTIGGPAAQLEKAAKAGGARISGFCGGCPQPPPPPAAVSPESPSAPPPTSPESGSGGNGEVVLGAPLANPSGPAPATPEQSTAPAAPAPAPSAPAAPAAPATPRPVQQPRAFVTSPGDAVRAQQSMKKGFAGAGGSAPRANDGGGGSVFGDGEGTKLTGDLDANSMAIQFELIKNQIQRMTQMQNLMTNVMSAMHEQGMTAIRNVKA